MKLLQVNSIAHNGNEELKLQNVDLYLRNNIYALLFSIKKKNGNNNFTSQKLEEHLNQYPHWFILIRRFTSWIHYLCGNTDLAYFTVHSIKVKEIILDWKKIILFPL
jgi:hypothetical protein